MQALNKIINKIKGNHKVLLIFDYDGTLVPIVNKPEMAVLDKDTRLILEKLAKSNSVKIALVSGRDIRTLQELAGIKSNYILMYGIHGGEILINGKVHVNLPDPYREIIQKLKDRLSDLKKIPGIIIEDKKYSLSVHYRLASKNDAQIAINRFKEIINSSGIILNKNDDKCCFRFQEGKKVLEILPCGFNKGNAVDSLILDNPDYFPVYFGDDKTDIVSFDKVKNHSGISVSVGNELDLPVDQVISVSEVRHFLETISNIAS